MIKSLIQYFLLLGLMTTLGFGCQSLYKSQFKEDSANLFYEDTAKRAELVSDVEYFLDFEIGKEKAYKASVDVEFNINKSPEDLFLDLQSAKLKTLTVNSLKLTVNNSYNGFKVFINKQYLRKGKNKVTLVYDREYVKDGNGLHQSTDPEDDKVYLYTNLQPYHASRVFPGFDQPDLKAVFKMKITAPKNWQIITSVLEDEVKLVDGKKQWSFPESPKMSTYLWSLHAGPYAVFKGPKKPYPMRLFVRQSLKKHVNPKEWFPITFYGFKYFEELFGVKYPFKKYDQIIVPEFNPGAMENIAAVTFNEAYLSRGQKTILQKYSLAEVVLHELAHMWFGNLVTMKWWDDLWLNESFATFVSNLALSEHPKFKEYSWPEFYNMKLWAYSEDLMPTTHAIYTEVESTDVAFNQFDGITYGKGAAWLKQLYYRVGKKQFSEALEIYFKRHKYSNTVLNDFIQAFVEVNGDKNKKWSETWLKTAGVNKLQFECIQGKYSLKQEAVSGEDIKRDHIGVLKTNEGTFKWSSVKEKIVWSDKQPKSCSDWNYANFNDQGYFLVEYSNRDLEQIKKQWRGFKDAFLRKMLINDLWHSTLYGNLSSKAYFEFIVYVLQSETDINVINTSLSTYKMNNIESTFKQISEKVYKKHFNELESLLYSRLQSTAPGSDLQKQFFKSYIEYSISEKSNVRIVNWLSGKNLPKKLNYDLDLKWQSVTVLAEKKANYKSFLNKLKKQDKSLKAKNYLEKISAITADVKQKRELFVSMFEDKNPNLYTLKYKVSGLDYAISYKEYDNKVAYDFLEKIKKANTVQKQEVLGRLVRLSPRTCDLGIAKKVRDFVDSNHSNLNKVLTKNLKKSAKYNELCVNMIKNY